MTLESGLFTMVVPAQGATKAHVRFALHTTDPDEVGAVALCATVASAILFERLQAHWTHLLLSLNGEPRVDVLGRWEDDGLDLTWQPKTVEPARMEEIASRIRDKTFLIGKTSSPQTTTPAPERVRSTPVQSAPTPEEQERAPLGLADHELTPEEEDWRVKQLLRIP